MSDTTGRPTWREAAVWAAGVSLLFMAVYSTTNALAAMRADVPAVYFPWELRIPLVPAMIVPYMSIDLFFVGSFFICATRREMRAHATRLATAIAVAGLFFAMFPLKLGFARTPVTGVFGPVFALLRGFDQPHNLAPSLHIALLSILWVVYTRHTEGLLNGAVRVWFILIVASTLLTHQHQLLDVVTGQILALWCLYMLPDRAARLPANRRRVYSAVLGRRYAIGAGVLVMAGIAGWPWGGLLLWPAFSLLMISLGYWGMGPGVFRKVDGRLPIAARFWLAPVLSGTWIVQRWMMRGAVPHAEVLPGVRLGRRPGRREVAELESLGVARVLDLTAEYDAPAWSRHVEYAGVPMLDMAAPEAEDLSRCVEHVERARKGGGVYIHCAMGLGRSVMVAAAYLLASGRASDVEQAVEAVRRVRPGAKLTPEMVSVLEAWDRGRVAAGV